MMKRNSTAALMSLLYLWLGFAGYSSAGHPPAGQGSCTEIDIQCAKTVSAAVAADGRIWLAWVAGQHLYVNYSDDRGQTLSAPTRVNAKKEVIAARGENRPKLATDQAGNLYLSWVKKLPEKWTSEIRFTWSADQGKSFSQPITINDDKRITSHSFNEMLVTDNGQVSISWLDGRRGLAAKEQEKPYTGSAIYLASFNPAETSTAPKNTHLIDGSCVCCRLAMALDQQELPIIMWRHIFGDNYRDHALLVFNDKEKPRELRRVSFENWQVDGCPHHGPTLVTQSHDYKQRIHMAWFNDAPKASGLFYAHSDDEGKNLSTALHIADHTTNPSHPHLALTAAGKLQIVWQEFDGQQHKIKLMRSNNGAHWTKPELITQYQGTTDYPFLLTHPKGNLLLWHKLGQPLQLHEVN